MTPAEIKGLIREKKISQNRLARRLRVSPTSLSFFVNGKLKSDKIAGRLARFLNIDEAQFEPPVQQ